jgi:hypothetical protein
MSIGVPTTNPIYPSSTEGLTLKSKNGMPLFLNGAIYHQYGASTALASSTTETSLFAGATAFFGTRTVNAGGLSTGWTWPNIAGVGSMLKLRMGGIMTDTTTPNLTVRLTVTNTAGTVSTLTTTGALALVAITGTANWFLEANIMVTAYSATVGSFLTTGRFDYGQTTLLTTGLNLPSTTLGSLDTTNPFTFDCLATWGTSSASNSITTQFATLDILN